MSMTTYEAQYLEAQESHWWFRARERVLQSFARSVIPHRVDTLVADVGSGPGGPTWALFPTARILAFDLKVELLQKYYRAGGRIVADAVRLPCRAGRVPIVCAFDILEHLGDDQAALQEWRRIMAPSGWLILSVPAYPSLWSEHDEFNGHHRRYRAHHLRRLLSNVGLTVVRLSYFNTFLFPGVAAVRWLQGCVRHATPHSPEARQLDFQQRFPGWIERSCERLFSLEARWIHTHSFPVGVSIVVAATNGK